MRNTLTAFALLSLSLTSCAGTAAIGPGISAKEQLLQRILTSPVTVCTAILTEDTEALSGLKRALTQPLPPAVP